MFSQVNIVLQNAVGNMTPAAQLVLRWRGETALTFAGGWLDPDTQQHATQPDTLFDLASLTKLFTTTTLMTLVEAGHVALGQPIYTVLAEFDETRPVQAYEDPLSPGDFVTIAEDVERVDARRVTFRHLLAHNAGLPAWRPLYKQPDAESARQMALHTFFSYAPGTRVVYSDLGLILIGLAIERLTGQSLDYAMRERVLEPLGLEDTGFLTSPISPRPTFPLHTVEREGGEKGIPSADAASQAYQGDREGGETAASSVGNVAPTEFCKWRGKRIVGEVHDENARRLGGVSGHAGLFSTASDAAIFGQIFLDRAAMPRGAPLLRPETVDEMTSLQAKSGTSRRGLGFGLWSPDPEASGNPFSQRAFGHTGFTGTSLWIDPARNLVVALITNEVYNGRESRAILTLRINVHRAVVETLDKMGK